MEENIVREVRDLLLGSTDGTQQNEAYIRSNSEAPVVAFYCTPENAQKLLHTIAEHTPEEIQQKNITYENDGKGESLLVIRGSKAIKSWLKVDEALPEFAREAMESYGRRKDAEVAQTAPEKNGKGLKDGFPTAKNNGRT